MPWLTAEERALEIYETAGEYRDRILADRRAVVERLREYLSHGMPGCVRCQAHYTKQKAHCTCGLDATVKAILEDDDDDEPTEVPEPPVPPMIDPPAQ